MKVHRYLSAAEECRIPRVSSQFGGVLVLIVPSSTLLPTLSSSVQSCFSFCSCPYPVSAPIFPHPSFWPCFLIPIHSTTGSCPLFHLSHLFPVLVGFFPCFYHALISVRSSTHLYFPGPFAFFPAIHCLPHLLFCLFSLCYLSRLPLPPEPCNISLEFINHLHSNLRVFPDRALRVHESVLLFSILVFSNVIAYGIWKEQL